MLPPAKSARRVRPGPTVCLTGLAACVAFLLVLAGCSSASKSSVAAAGGLCLGPVVGSSGEGSTGPPRPLAGQLPARLAAKYALFRRAAILRDRPPGTATAFARELGASYQLASYYPAAVRAAAVVGSGRRYLIVPAFARQEPLPPANCVSSVQYRELQEQQARRATETVYCVVEVRGQRVSPASACTPFAANDEGGEVFSGAGIRGRPIIELAPDSVASVRIVAPGGEVTARTDENVFTFTSPPPAPSVQNRVHELERQIATSKSKAQRESAMSEYNNLLTEARPKHIEWLNKNGSLIRAIPASNVSRGPHSVGDLRAPIEG